MNQVAWQIFGGSKTKANTFIGGVASTITTSGALATKLGIASNRITNFKIVGSDIECRISGSYVIPDSCFRSDTSITYYYDYENCTLINYRAFRDCTNLSEVVFDNVTYIDSQAFYKSVNLKKAILKSVITIGFQAFDGDGIISKLSTLYAPNCTILGGTIGFDFVFRNQLNVIFYCHPSLATNNAGAPDGDITNTAFSNKVIPRYVTNYTPPSSITNLSVGNVYGTAVQLNFTAPSSTNAIDYYEVWLNGVNSGKRITASGEYAIGLTLNTAYTFQLIPVDIFYNKSTSNSLTVSTSIDNLEILLSGLSLYYNINKTESYPGTGLSLNDISGNSNNGLLVNGTGYNSTDGGSLVFDGINDYVSIVNPTSIASQNFTISLWIKPLAPPNAITALFDYDHGTAGSTQGYVIQSEDATTNRRYYLAFYTASGFQPSGFIGSGQGVQITNGVWQMLSYVKNGNLITGYINDVELYKVTAANGTVIFIPNKNASLGTAVSSTGRITKGNISKNMIYNRALTENEIAFNFSQTRSIYGI